MAITWKNIDTPGFGSVAQQSAIGTNTLNKNIGNLANIAGQFQKQALAAEAEALAAPQKAFDLNQQQLANQALLTKQGNLPARQNIENLIASGDITAANAAIAEFEGADTTGFSRGIDQFQAQELAKRNAAIAQGRAGTKFANVQTQFGQQQQDRTTRLADEASRKAMNANLADVSSSGLSREEMQNAGKAIILQGGGSPADLAAFNRSLVTTIDTEDLRTGTETVQINQANVLATQQSEQRLQVARDEFDKIEAANPIDPVVTADNAAVKITDVIALGQDLAKQTSWWPGSKSAEGLTKYIDTLSEASWIVDKKEGVRKATPAEVKAGKGVKAKPWMLKRGLMTATDTDEANWFFNPSTDVEDMEKIVGRLATDQTNIRRQSAQDEALARLREVEQAEIVTSAANRASIPENIRRQ